MVLEIARTHHLPMSSGQDRFKLVSEEVFIAAENALKEFAVNLVRRQPSCGRTIRM